MSYQAHDTTFLPLTVAAARTAEEGAGEPPHRASACVIRQKAEEANSAAAECWRALLAGCHTPSRTALPSRLRDLSEATSIYVGSYWWFSVGSTHRRRVSEAEDRIGEAVLAGDGADFAEAFIGYDQALASAVVRVQSTLGST